MARLVIGVLSALAWCWWCAAPALAEKRVALVIGIDAYVEVPALRKAAGDARAIAAALTTAGFSVTMLTNVGRRGLNRGIADLQKALAPGDVALFHFSGHGVVIDGQNYLLPADVPKPAAGDKDYIKDEAISLDSVLTRLDTSGAATRILIVDACRDNPFAAVETHGIGSERGLARVEAPRDTIIMYSAGYGQTALDRLGESDADPNSVYTRVLLRQIAAQGRDITEIAKAVRSDVAALAKSVGHDQFPAYYDELNGAFFLRAGAAADPGASPPEMIDPIVADYQLAERVGTRAAWDEFLARHGSLTSNFHVELAKAARQKLAATDAPPPPVQSQTPVEACGGDRVSVSTSGQPRCLKPGETFLDCDECPEMVVIPAGNFTMGSPYSEMGRGTEESPQHEVIIGTPFAVGKFEITFAEWENCLNDGGCKAYRPVDWGWGRGARPVVMVGWDDAQSYVAWLSRKVGAKYRLLSEAEWEYAARAGTITPFSTGERITTDQANFNGSSTYNGSSIGEFRNQTMVVGSFEANGFGIYDMHGNVMEWTEDCYYDSHVRAPKDGSAREGSGSCLRVARGGSWGREPTWMRSAFRIGGRPDFRNGGVGFRVARTL